MVKGGRGQQVPVVERHEGPFRDHLFDAVHTLRLVNHVIVALSHHVRPLSARVLPFLDDPYFQQQSHKELCARPRLLVPPLVLLEQEVYVFGGAPEPEQAKRLRRDILGDIGLHVTHHFHVASERFAHVLCELAQHGVAPRPTMDALSVRQEARHPRVGQHLELEVHRFGRIDRRSRFVKDGLQMSRLLRLDVHSCRCWSGALGHILGRARATGTKSGRASGHRFLTSVWHALVSSMVYNRRHPS